MYVFSVIIGNKEDREWRARCWKMGRRSSGGRVARERVGVVSTGEGVSGVVVERDPSIDNEGRKGIGRGNTIVFAQLLSVSEARQVTGQLEPASQHRISKGPLLAVPLESQLHFAPQIN